MTKQQLENYKKNIEKIRAEKARELEEKTQNDTLQQEKSVLQPLERYIESDGEEDLIQIYEDWLKQYKDKHPGFDENENKYELDENGHGLINFSDPQAEEDFLRHMAENISRGIVLDKGTHIATLENGMLIDPRTNREFPEGEYAALVQKLDSGIAYNDIPSPRATRPTPFSTTPY